MNLSRILAMKKKFTESGEAKEDKTIENNQF
jgi:hypothetical protein